MDFEWFDKSKKESKNIVKFYDYTVRMNIDRTKIGNQVVFGLDEINRAIAIKPVKENGSTVKMYKTETRVNCRPFVDKLKQIGIPMKTGYSTYWDEAEQAYIVTY
jgi:hypothetical protein